MINVTLPEKGGYYFTVTITSYILDKKSVPIHSYDYVWSLEPRLNYSIVAALHLLSSKVPTRHFSSKNSAFTQAWYLSKTNVLRIVFDSNNFQ